MTTFIHADIFFFVTTVCVAVVAIFMVIAIIYLIRILDKVNRLSEKAHRDGSYFFDQLRQVGDRMSEKKSLFAFIGGTARMVRRLIIRYS